MKKEEYMDILYNYIYLYIYDYICYMFAYIDEKFFYWVINLKS